MCTVLMFYYFSEHVVLRSCTTSCGTASIFMSQMAVGFWNAIRTDVSFGVFIINAKGILFFILLSCFKQCVLGLSGLLGLDAVIILPFYCNAVIAWRCFSFFLVSQAFTTMLAKRGTVFVRGCIGYHFDGLLSQLLVALHPLVLFIAM